MTTIKSITARGFKSFAKKTELLFGNGYNSIIGPNGSGKSNIADALCFVLGKGSAKGLRAEKTANLIFNGGKKGSPASEAEVSIIFDNSKKTFPVKDKEVKITRSVKKSGNSTYRINSEIITRQQVLGLLNAAKIDPDGHNIILQGDITRFTVMKSNERRELIEEIAGISVYEDRKRKALNELEKVDGKLKEVNIILTERETYLKELKNERDQALKYKNLEKNIRDNKATYLHLQIKEKEEKKQDIEKKIKSQQDEIDAINKKTAGITKILEEKKASLEKINKEVESKGEVEQKKIHEEIEYLKTEFVKDTSKKESYENEIARIKNRKVLLEKNLQGINDKIKELETEKQRKEKQLNLFSNNDKNFDSQISKLKIKHDIKEDANVDDQIDKLRKDLEELYYKKQNNLREKDKIDLELGNINLKDNKELLDKVKALRQEFKDATLALSKNNNEYSVAEARLSKERRRLLDISEELVRLEAREIRIKEVTAGDAAVKKILDSNINGVYGIVAELGEVNAKYKLALGVAAGPRIKSIVAENDVIAAKCINLLKNNKLGVATFLPLNKLKVSTLSEEAKNLSKNEGVVDLAINLVKFDDKFKNVFSYVFGNTLVVNDLESARRIGIGRNRMVTLEGDLIEVSGAMIGGYRRKEAMATFKEKDMGSDIDKLKDEVESLRKSIPILENSRDELEEKISGLRTKKAELEGEIIGIERYTGNVSELREKEKGLSGKLKDISKEINELDKNIAGLNKELEKLKERKQKLKKDPKVIEALTKLEEERRGNKEKIIELNSEIKGIDVQINSIYLQERDKTFKIIKDIEKESENFDKEIGILEERIKSNKALLREKDILDKRFYSDFKNLFSKRNRISEEINKIENAIIREREKIKAVETRVNNFNLDRAKIVAEFEGLNKEFEDFVDAKIKKNLNLDDLKYEIRKAEGLLQGIGNVNLRALEVYEDAAKEYEKLLVKVDKLKLEKNDVMAMMEEIDSKKKDLFMKTFKAINKDFSDIFSQLSKKGNAHLEIENENDLFNSGVDIKVRIIGNKFLDIKSLSGGEKTLTALAFIFAIQEYDPASFYFLDEVDAALDKRNSELLSKLIEKYSKNAQYIVITHNDAIISGAEYIYGISMQDEISKVISLKV